MKIEDHTSRKVKISGVDRLFLFPVVEFGGCENFSVARGGGAIAQHESAARTSLLVILVRRRCSRFYGQKVDVVGLVRIYFFLCKGLV